MLVGCFSEAAGLGDGKPALLAGGSIPPTPAMDIPSEWGVEFSAEPAETVWLDSKEGFTFPIKAFVFGDWALHKTVLSPGWTLETADSQSWSVAHIPSKSVLSDDCGIVAYPFWTSLNIARALGDSGIVIGRRPSKDTIFLFEAIVGSAIADHYVWPLPSTGTYGQEADT